MKSKDIIENYLSELYSKDYKGLDTKGQGSEGVILILKRIMERTKLPRKLIHLTPSKNIESILEKGLVDRGINRMGGRMAWSGIYLSNDPDLYESEDFDRLNTAEVEVLTSGLDKDKLEFDYEYHSGDLLDSDIYTPKGKPIEDEIADLARDYSTRRKFVYVIYHGDIPKSAIDVDDKFLNAKALILRAITSNAKIRFTDEDLDDVEVPKGTEFEIIKSHYTGGYYLKLMNDITVDGRRIRKGAKAFVFGTYQLDRDLKRIDN